MAAMPGRAHHGHVVVDHDRHLRFDQRAAGALGRGADDLAKNVLSKTSTLGLLDATVAAQRKRLLSVAARR